MREGQTNNSRSAVKANSSVGRDARGQGSKAWVGRGRERAIAHLTTDTQSKLQGRGAAAARTLRSF